MIFVVREGWRALRMARAALKRWRQLPEAERVRLRGHVEALAPLTVELARVLASRGPETRGREPALIVRDVQAELGKFGQAAPTLLEGLGPKSLAGRLAVGMATNVGKAAHKRAGALRRAEPAQLDEVGDDAELAEVLAELSAVSPAVVDDGDRAFVLKYRPAAQDPVADEPQTQTETGKGGKTMGLLRSIGGFKGYDRVSERILAEIEERRARGEHEFWISYTQLEIGGRNSASTFVPMLRRKIEKAGHQVVEGEGGSFGETVRLRVRCRRS